MCKKTNFIIKFEHPFRSIKTKILFAFLLIDFIVSFLLTAIFNHIYSKSLIEKNLQSYGNTLGVISNNIDFLTESIENYARLIISSRDTQMLLRTDYTQNPLKELRDAGNVKGTFVNLIGRDNIINSIFLIKYVGSGKEIYDIGNSSNITFDNVIPLNIADQFSQKRNNTLWNDVHLSKFKVMNREKNVFSYYRSMMDMNTGYIEGILCMNVNEETISSIFSKVVENFAGKFMIVNKNGIVMSSTETTEVLKDISDQPYINQMLHGTKNGSLQYVNGEKVLITTYHNQKLDWNIICFIPYSDLISIKTQRSALLFLISTLVFLGSIIVSALISSKITKPILFLANILSTSVVNREKDLQNLQLKIEKTTNDEIGILQTSIDILLHKISELVTTLKQEQKLKREYELASINAQLKPHFLYNSINSICGLLYINEQDTALSMLQALGEYYKYSLGKGRELIPISEELKITESYITIQKNKYRGNLNCFIEIDQQVNKYLIPKFTIQPIVENCFKHAFIDSKKQSLLNIDCRYDFSGYIFIQIIDNGSNGNANVINSLLNEDMKATPNGFGLKSIQNRLKLYYETDFSLHAESVYPQGIKIVIAFPAKEDKSC